MSFGPRSDRRYVRAECPTARNQDRSAVMATGPRLARPLMRPWAHAGEPHTSVNGSARLTVTVSEMHNGNSTRPSDATASIDAEDGLRARIGYLDHLIEIGLHFVSGTPRSEATAPTRQVPATDLHQEIARR